MATISTPITKMFGIKHPILLAGMSGASGPDLAAAVTNAGGLGVIGGVRYSPKALTKLIDSLKSKLSDPNAPFGIDLLLPQVGGSARKTNYDYTEGNLEELIDIVITSNAKLFVSAVGVPPRWVVDKLHGAGIHVMNMVGSPNHVKKALDVGVDLICAQGGEGGGHTGDVASSILIPKVVDLCKDAKSPLTGDPVYVVAAGGIFDGRGLAAALCWGAKAVWVGTRFVCAKESDASSRAQEAIIKAGYHDTVRTLVYSGRPMRVLRSAYTTSWEEDRRVELKELLSKGIVPIYHDLDSIEAKSEGDTGLVDIAMNNVYPVITGQAAGAITEVKPAADIINEMMTDACEAIRTLNSLVPHSKL